MSLQSRLDIVCDEADGESGLTIDGGNEASSEISTGKSIPQLDLQLLRKQCSLLFPRRVFVPWLAGTCICDYLQPSETLEVLKDHCVELMSMEAPVDASTILEPETEAPTLTTKSFWDVAVPFFPASSPDHSSLKKSQTDTSKQSDRNLTKSANFNMTAAVMILVFSILVGLVLFVIRGS